jgi:hypothetical protein
VPQLNDFLGQSGMQLPNGLVGKTAEDAPLEVPAADATEKKA